MAVETAVRLPPSTKVQGFPRIGIIFVTVQRFSRVFMQLVYATTKTKLLKGKDSKGCYVKGVKFLLYCE